MTRSAYLAVCVSLFATASLVSMRRGIEAAPQATDSVPTFARDVAPILYTNCVACHQASGKGTPPVFPPLDGSKVVTGPKEGEMDVVMHGRPNTAMQAFAKQLNDVEIAAVLTFTRNNWSNKVGDLVQPAEVKAARK